MSSTSAPFVLLNPHVGDWVAKPLSFALLRRRALLKYGYLLTEPQKRGERVSALVCGSVSGLIPLRLFSLLPNFFRRPWLRCELWLWRKTNDVAHVDIGFAPQDSQLSQPLVVFSWKNAEKAGFDVRLQIMKRFPKVVVNLSHYFVNTAEKAACLSQLPNLIFWSESDISENAYFRRYFGWYRAPMMVVPFCVQDRFKPPAEEEKREAKAVATGSFHFLPDEKPRQAYEDFMRFWGVTNYHFLRNDLYQQQNKNGVGDKVTVLCSPYREKKKAFHWLQRLTGAGQKKYFAVNIVEVYQRHRFACVGEERSGNPGIGIFEAMACGAIPIIKPECYAGLDIAGPDSGLFYDGSVDSFLQAVQTPLSEERAAFLQRKAQDYVETHCRAAQAYGSFIKGLSGLSGV